MIISKEELDEEFSFWKGNFASFITHMEIEYEPDGLAQAIEYLAKRDIQLLATILCNKEMFDLDSASQISLDKVTERIADIITNYNPKFTFTEGMPDAIYNNPKLINLSLQNDFLNSLKFINEDNVDLFASIIFQMVKDGESPAYYCPTWILYEHRYEIYPPEIADFIAPDVFGTFDRPPRYSEENEQKLLDYINRNSNGKKYECIDDYVAGLIARDKPTTELSALEIGILTFYTNKLQYQNGVQGAKAIYMADELGSNVASKPAGLAHPNNKYIEINVSNTDNSTRLFAEVLFHEAFHTVQFQYIEDHRTDLDPDLDLYYKDDILISLIPDYYKQDYWSVAEEYDADFNSHYHIHNLLQKNRNTTNQMDNVTAYYEWQTKGHRYHKDGTRHDGSEFDLDKQFCAVVNQRLADPKYRWVVDKIRNNPILSLQYRYDEERNLFIENTDEQMFKEYLKCEPDSRKEWFYLSILTRHGFILPKHCPGVVEALKERFPEKIEKLVSASRDKLNSRKLLKANYIGATDTATKRHDSSKR